MHDGVSSLSCHMSLSTNCTCYWIVGLTSAGDIPHSEVNMMSAKKKKKKKKIVGVPARNAGYTIECQVKQN